MRTQRDVGQPLPFLKRSHQIGLWVASPYEYEFLYVTPAWNETE